MNASRRILAYFVLFLSLLTLPSFVNAKTLKGKVSEVTLFRGQAQVVRVVKVVGKAGHSNLVITDLPERILSGSLFAEGSKGLQVRAVRYRVRSVNESPRKNVRDLDRGIEEIASKRTLVYQSLGILKHRRSYLNRLEKALTPTIRSGSVKGTLQPEKLMKMTMFLFKQRQSIAEEMGKLNRQLNTLNRKLRVLRSKRYQLTSSKTRYIREAVVFLEKSDNKAKTLRLTYRVNGCTWSPSYNVRGDSKKKNVQMEYNALIVQKSGEDWIDVKLRLSTASPTLSAAGPGLAPFKVTLKRGQGRTLRKAAMLRRFLQIRRNRHWAYKRYINSIKRLDNDKSSWALNSSASKGQMLELNTAGKILKFLASENKGEGPNIAYQLAGSLTLASRSDQQMIRIMQTDMKAKLYYVATPILTRYVYREAEVRNRSGKDLLKGPVSVYLDGRFVGRTELPTVSSGQTFLMGFGAAPQLRVRRRLVKKDRTKEGGNSTTAFAYQIRIENFRAEAVQIRVQDRIPFVDNSTDVRIKLAHASQPISKDKVYRRLERPNGILRWEVKVPGFSSGEKAKVLDYKYKVTHDKNFHLASPNSYQARMKQKREFFKLQFRRYTR